MSALPIAVTCGDPAGVGPELLASWLQAHPAQAASVVPIGPADWIAQLGQGLAVGFLPMAVFGLGKHITRIGKGGHPSPVLQPRVPPHMVGMHVGATHKINLFGRDAGLRQRLQIRELGVVPARSVHPLFVIAHARVHQYPVPPGLDQVAVKRHDGAVLFVQVGRPQPTGMGVDVGLRDARQNVFQRCKRAFVFGDPIDGELPELLRFHVDAFGTWAHKRHNFSSPRLA